MTYCTIQEFKDLGLPADAISEIDDTQLQLFIDTAAGTIDTFIGDRYAVPADPDNSFLKRCNVDLAACDILLWRGYNPEEGDEVYRMRCAKWMKLLEDIRKGSLSIPGLDPVSPAGSGGPRVSSKTRRGYLGNRRPDGVGGVN